jgi:ERCC4-type nuclease
LLSGHTQNLKKVVSLLVSLRKKAQRERRNWIVAPGSEKSNEEQLALLDRFPLVSIESAKAQWIMYLGIKVAQSLSHI